MRTRHIYSVALVLPLALFASSSGISCGGDAVNAGADSGTGDGSARDSGGGNPFDSGQSEEDAGPTCGPFAGGEPVEAPENEWTWVGVPEAKCRNGSPTGFGIRRKASSDKLFIYLQGGGACFNGPTCVGNPGSFDSGTFTSWAGSSGKAGVMNDEHADNPVKDWNAIFLPYCSGDVFAGSAPDGGGAGTGRQNFSGVANIQAFLKRIVPTFPSVNQIMLTGSSAGGFGAALNYEQVATAFCPRPVVLIDDSGPPMSDTYIAPCLQSRWRSLWNMDEALGTCPNCSLPDGGGIVNMVPYLVDKFPQGRFGLISSDKDGTIRFFFSYGNNDCSGIDGFPPSGYEGARFAEGLQNLRDTYLKKSSRFGSYYVPSETHTYLLGDSFFTTTVGGVSMPKWMGDILKGETPAHVGP